MQGGIGTWGGSFYKTCRFVRIYEKLENSLPFASYDAACDEDLGSSMSVKLQNGSLQLATVRTKPRGMLGWTRFGEFLYLANGLSSSHARGHNRNDLDVLNF